MARRLSTVVGLLLAGCGGSSSSDRAAPDDAGPPPAPLRLAYPAGQPPPPVTAAPVRSIGRGGAPVYPTPVVLTLAPGVAALDPPLRVQRVWPVPGRPLAAASGTAAEGPTIQLIDVDRGSVRWSHKRCRAGVLHTTADRIVCGSPQGTGALDVDDGELLWHTPRVLRAARDRWLFVREPDDPLRGAILDAQTGEPVLELAAARGETLDEVHELCAVDDGFDLIAWSETGLLRRLHAPRTRGPQSEARRVWARRLARPPSKVEPCDPVMLVEVPTPGAEERTLSALHRKTGLDAAPGVAVLGWWPARAGDGIEVATADGIQVRTRTFEVRGQVASGRAGGRLVAEWQDLRLIRSVGGTLLLLDGKGVRAWLAAPAWNERAVLTGSRILGGSWLSPPYTAAEHLTLWELPARGQPVVDLPMPAPTPATIPEPPPQKLPPLARKPGTAIRLDRAGTYAVSDVLLAGERLHAITLEGRPDADRGAGVAVFDLAARRWAWHRDDVCGRAATPGLTTADGVVICSGRPNYPARGSLRALAATDGADLWKLELPTVDGVAGAGSVVVALVGARAVVIDARTGKRLWDLPSDNGHLPRIVPVAPEVDGKRRTLVVAVESGGHLVARDPAAGGAVAWTVQVRGYVRRLARTRDGVAVLLASGELVTLSAADGKPATAGAWGESWLINDGTDLLLDTPPASEGVTMVRGFGLDGAERLRSAFAITPPLEVASLRGPGAPVALVTMRGLPRVMAVDPGRGRLESVWALPPDFVRGGVFSALVGGKPVVGVVGERPAGVYLW